VNRVIPDTEDYHLRSMELCLTREQLGGIKAVESTRWASSIAALKRLGLTDEQIVERMRERL